ncbi:MAG: hypothetical protein ABMA64_28310, partial [Myxococcota bacterium]
MGERPDEPFGDQAGQDLADDGPRATEGIGDLAGGASGVAEDLVEDLRRPGVRRSRCGSGGLGTSGVASLDGINGRS